MMTVTWDEWAPYEVPEADAPKAAEVAKAALREARFDFADRPDDFDRIRCHEDIPCQIVYKAAMLGRAAVGAPVPPFDLWHRLVSELGDCGCPAADPAPQGSAPRVGGPSALPPGPAAVPAPPTVTPDRHDPTSGEGRR